MAHFLKKCATLNVASLNLSTSTPIFVKLFNLESSPALQRN